MKSNKISKNPKAVKYYVYVLSIIPRTARACEGLNIYIRSRLLHVIELDTAKLRTKLRYRFIFSEISLKTDNLSKYEAILVFHWHQGRPRLPTIKSLAQKRNSLRLFVTI